MNGTELLLIHDYVNLGYCRLRSRFLLQGVKLCMLGASVLRICLRQSHTKYRLQNKDQVHFCMWRSPWNPLHTQ